ncbi:MAG: TRAP transporter large permease subunit [Caldilineaceae bacterium]
MFFGIATPTEAGAVGSVGACLLAALNGRLTWKNMWDAANSTAHHYAGDHRLFFVPVFLVWCLTIWAASGSLPNCSPAYRVVCSAFLIVSNLAVFFLGMFLEFIEIVYIVLPLFVPAAMALGIDLVWFGVVMAINLQIAFISPPVGFSLFYLQSVAPPEMRTSDIHRSAFPVMAIQVIILILVMYFPQTVTWLIQASYKFAQ